MEPDLAPIAPKLACLLRMLTSEHDGEVVAAARATAARRPRAEIRRRHDRLDRPWRQADRKTSRVAEKNLREDPVMTDKPRTFSSDLANLPAAPQPLTTKTRRERNIRGGPCNLPKSQENFHV
jgi:hypothetical protein